ncbi:MAG: DUF192 domain-containing protein [Dehalococcoidales bacterium]|nr:DUF192 domain-containing protein [Dehalococcoidales bacterium]
MAGQAVVRIKDKEWLVSLAVTPWELEQGLGGLPELPMGTGMLFDLGVEQTIHVTTVPMLFPLDIAFLSEELTVTEVYRNIEPGYLVTGTQPARYFIEVNAGELEGIAPGDTASVEFLPFEEVPVAPDWIPMMFGLTGFLLLGTITVNIARDFTGKALEEPKEKPALLPQAQPRNLPQTAKKPTRDEVKVDAWQERDRLGIWLTDRRTDKVIAEWWDEDAREMFEQGWFKPGVPQHANEKPSRAFVDSVLDYAESVGMLAGGKYVVQTGTCYADAWRFLIKEEEGTLVHGTVFSSGRRMGHAWVETLTGWTWEPQTGRYFTNLGFRDAFAPDGEIRYTAEQAAIMAARAKHLGPWTKEERQRYLKEKSPAAIPQPHSPKSKDKLEFLPDSPEYLAYTIDDIGYRDRIDSAFVNAIARAREKRS